MNVGDRYFRINPTGDDRAETLLHEAMHAGTVEDLDGDGIYDGVGVGDDGYLTKRRRDKYVIPSTESKDEEKCEKPYTIGTLNKEQKLSNADTYSEFAKKAATQK